MLLLLMYVGVTSTATAVILVRVAFKGQRDQRSEVRRKKSEARIRCCRLSSDSMNILGAGIRKLTGKQIIQGNQYYSVVRRKDLSGFLNLTRHQEDNHVLCSQNTNAPPEWLRQNSENLNRY